MRVSTIEWECTFELIVFGCLLNFLEAHLIALSEDYIRQDSVLSNARWLIGWKNFDQLADMLPLDHDDAWNDLENCVFSW